MVEQEPQSIYDLAKRLIEDGHDETSFTIKGGVLIMKSMVPFRKFTNSDNYADLAGLKAFVSKDHDGNRLEYKIHYFVVNCEYDQSGELDAAKIWNNYENSASITCQTISSYASFHELTKDFALSLQEGINAMSAKLERIVEEIPPF